MDKKTKIFIASLTPYAIGIVASELFNWDIFMFAFYGGWVPIVLLIGYQIWFMLDLFNRKEKPVWRGPDGELSFVKPETIVDAVSEIKENAAEPPPVKTGKRVIAGKALLWISFAPITLLMVRSVVVIFTGLRYSWFISSYTVYGGEAFRTSMFLGVLFMT
ncbi:MAG: hypothetical protein LBK41_06775, partial [Clostridiales bacterium]|nr:hypothetical protein [Clostridiales bacterium]